MLLTLALTIAMVIPMGLPAVAVGPNLITNGDFEAGNTGFTTEYKYLDPSIQGIWTLGPEYMYTIGTNPSLYHSQWTSFGDHSDVGDKMMIVNGTWEETSPTNRIVWEQTVSTPACEPAQYDLYAGQNMLVGDVFVKTDTAGKVCVRFVLDAATIADGWKITEAHVAAAANCDLIPQTKPNKQGLGGGNPIPGQFPGKGAYNPGVLETPWICVDYPWVAGTEICVAAHAVISKTECVVTVAAGSGSFVSDTSTMVTSTDPDHTAVATNTGTYYGIDTWKNTTGSDSWAPGSTWIWESNPVVNPILGDIVTFEKSFNIAGPPTAGTGELKIAVDNGYAVWLNGHFVGKQNLFQFVGADNDYSTALLGDLKQPYVDTTNWQTVGTYSNLAPYLVQGTNVLKIMAVNEYMNPDDAGQPIGTTLLNPGGMVFKFTYAWNEVRTCTTYTETAWGDGGGDFSGANWATCIDYTPCNRDYTFSFWAANSFPGNPTWPAQPAILEAQINGVVVGTALALAYTPPTAPSPGWLQYTATWNPGAATSAKIQIRDKRYIMYGDDFCLDDISFVKNP